jgi:hypothetical protein
VTCSNSIPAALRRSKQAWSFVGPRLVCSAGAQGRQIGTAVENVDPPTRRTDAFLSVR